MKKLFGPVTKTIKVISQDVTKSITETSKRNNKALTNLNNKFLELMNDRGILACCLLSQSFEITNLEHTGQIKLVKDRDSNRVNDLLTNRITQVTL